MTVPMTAEQLEEQRLAALHSAAALRLIVLKHRVQGLRDLIHSAKSVGSPAERIEHYRAVLKKAERELAAAEKESA